MKLDDIYAVYVKHDAPQIGFTVSIAFVFTIQDSNEAAIKDLFVNAEGGKSKFHREFKTAWQNYADTPKTLPVVLFADDNQFLFDGVRSIDRMFGSPVRITLPSGRTSQLERGFPYVSYVVHADLDDAVPERIHRCDFAMLMALPGFVEENVALIRNYRKRLTSVEQSLVKGKLKAAERKYNDAWSDFERIQGLAPETSAAVQRILQKYLGKSVFGIVANDNIKLIEFTINAAIAATEQVRANIQSFGQQRLQRRLNGVQWATLALTFVLMVGTLVSAWVAKWGVTKTQIADAVQIGQPIRVSSEIIPDASSRPQPNLDAIPLFNIQKYSLPTTIHLKFTQKIDELPLIIPTAITLPNQSYIEVLLLSQNGVVIGYNTISSKKTPAAIKIRVKKQIFENGGIFYVQVSQGSIWRLKLPIEVTISK